MTKSSLFLFAAPSFIKGLASIFDMGSTLNQNIISDSSREADYKAIQSDWSAIGGDMEYAVEEWERGK